MDSVRDKFGSLVSSEGVLIVLIPFVGTYIAFLFEAGFAAYYGVPIALIQIDFVKIIVSSAVVWIFVYLFFTLIEFARGVAGGSHPLRRALAFPLSATLVLSLFVVFTPLPHKLWIILSVFSFFCIVTYASPIFKKGDGETYIQRLESQIEKERKSAGNSGGKANNFAEFTSFLFVVSFFIFKSGLMLAEDKSRYYVMKDLPENVFVSNYGDVMVFAVSDKEYSRFTGEVVMVKLSDSVPISLLRKKTGQIQGVDNR